MPAAGHDPPSAGPRHLSLLLLIGGLLALLFLAHAVHLRAVTDDAYISFHFARHLATGFGLAWKEGDPPLEGYSNFLWVVFHALAYRAGLSLETTSLVLGLAAGLGVLAFALAFARRWFGTAAPPTLFVVSWLVACGPLAAWSAGGLETSLFACLILGGTYYTGSYARRGATADLVRLAVCFFLSCLTRPEGIGVTGIVLLASTLWWPRPAGNGAEHAAAGTPAPTRARLWRGVALGVFLPFAIYTLWRVSYFGSLLPNTFHAKTGGGADHVLRGARYLLYFARDYVLPLAVLVGVIAALGRSARSAGVAAARTGAGAAHASGDPERRFETRLLLALTVVFGAYVAVVGGDYMPMYRFLVPLVAPLALLAAAAVAPVGGGALATRGQRTAAALAVALALGLTFHHSTPLERDTFGKPPLLEGTYRGVLLQRWNTARLSHIGRFFRDHSRSPQESIAARGVGAIAYFSNLPVIDVLGIVDPHIARVQSDRHTLRKSPPGHEKRDWPYVLDLKPTYIVLKSRLKPAPLPVESITSDMGPDEVERVRREYDVVAVWVDDPVTRESGYFSFLERRDHVITR